MFIKMFRNVNDVADGAGWVALISLVVTLVSLPAWIFYPYTFNPSSTASVTLIDLAQFLCILSASMFVLAVCIIGMHYAFRNKIASIVVLVMLAAVTVLLMVAGIFHT